MGQGGGNWGCIQFRGHMNDGMEVDGSFKIKTNCPTLVSGFLGKTPLKSYRDINTSCSYVL